MAIQCRSADQQPEKITPEPENSQRSLEEYTAAARDFHEFLEQIQLVLSVATTSCIFGN